MAQMRILHNLTNNSLAKIENIIEVFNDISSDLKNKLVVTLKVIEEKYLQLCSSIDEEARGIVKDLFQEMSKTESEKTEVFNKIKQKGYVLDYIKTLENDLTNWKNLIDSKEKEQFDSSVIESNKVKLSEYQEKERYLQLEKIEIKELIDIYDFWKLGYSMSGIPSMLIDEAIPFMNDQIRYYLDQIGGRYIVAFDTLNKNKGGEFRDKISVNVFDTITKANMRKQLSGGQTRVVDIATILTLRDLQSNIQDMRTNIIILDEIFDSLDPKNIEYVSTVLRKMVKGNSINIISHSQIDQLDTDEVLRFF